ncbi:MAG: M36 family metallopeptidase, partial [Solirubrobacteraceae bacterium]
LRDPGYFGIRRFPYSIDRTKNALSFRHISDSEPLPDVPTNVPFAAVPNSESHNAGEVWATMMWEAYNVLLDAHSYADARRRMSDYVVAGLLLTPPDATFTEARDAILAAVSTLDRDDMLLIAAAFAGRGAGTCAVSPDHRVAGNLGVVESGTLAARLQTSGLRIADDGASCDHDGYLDPGESGTLRVTIANSGVVAAEGVAVQATTTTPGVTLGAPIVLGDVAPLTHVDLAIPVALSPNAPAGVTMDLALQVTGDAGCNTRALQVELHAPIGVDEAAAVATTDNLETSIVAWTPTGAPGHWTRTTDEAGNHVLFGTDAAVVSDTQLVSPVLQVSVDQPLVISWTHAYTHQGIGPPFGMALDGGVIELSTDGGGSWRDVTELGADPGYNSTVLSNRGNPLAGRRAFTASNPSFPRRDPLQLSFGTRLAGQAVQLRLRIGTDLSNAGSGWE